MLGSLHDAEDALQDALLRAWRGLPGFEGRSSVRSWLYAIATNAALDITRHRSRRELPVDFGPAAQPGQDADAAVRRAAVAGTLPGPVAGRGAGRVARGPLRAAREHRAGVRGRAAAAAAAAAGGADPARGRGLLGGGDLRSARYLGAQRDQRAPSGPGSPSRPGCRTAASRRPCSALGDQRTRAIARRYADAIERGDADTLISMLTKDATWSMPPTPVWYQGHAALRDWLLREPLRARWRHRVTRANGQLAVGCYLPGPGPRPVHPRPCWTC